MMKKIIIRLVLIGTPLRPLLKANHYRLVFYESIWSKSKNSFSRNLWKYDVECITSRSKKTRTTIAIKTMRKTTNVFLVIKTKWKQFNPITLLHSVIFIDWTYWDLVWSCLCVCFVYSFQGFPFVYCCLPVFFVCEWVFISVCRCVCVFDCLCVRADWVVCIARMFRALNRARASSTWTTVPKLGLSI